MNQDRPRQAAAGPGAGAPPVAGLTAPPPPRRDAGAFASDPSLFVFPASPLCFLHSHSETRGLAVFRLQLIHCFQLPMQAQSQQLLWPDRIRPSYTCSLV